MAVKFTFLRAVVASLCLLSVVCLSTQPALAADSTSNADAGGGSFSSYYSFSYNVHLSQSEVHPNQFFMAECTARVECLAAPPIEITDARLTGRLVAKRGSTTITIVNNYSVSVVPPDDPGQSLSDSLLLNLAFPAGSPTGSYRLVAELVSAEVKSGGVWLGVTSFLPPTQEIGNMNVINSGPYIVLNSPNGGESWTTGTSHALNWTAYNLSGYVKIELLRAGVPVSTLTSRASASASTYNWNLSAALTPGINYRIRITSTSTPAATDTSNGDFAIVLPVVRVISPNGGESWTTGTSHAVTWTVGLSGYVKIELLRAGAPVKTITSRARATSGSYNWKISTTQSPGSYRIRVTSTSNAAITDTSNGDFAIVLPAVRVISPNGGESWSAGNSHTITWAVTDLSGYVKIELLKGGLPVKTITSRARATAGSYNWNVAATQLPGVDYRIRITSTSNAAVTDTSNGNFTVVGPPPPAVRIVSPNGGESWSPGTSHTITWAVTDLSGYVKIELLKGGVPVKTITSRARATAGSYNWNVAATQLPGVDYRIRITSTSNAAVTDTSNGNFTVVGSPLP